MKKEKSIKIVTILTIITAAIAFLSGAINFLLPIYLANKFNINTKEAASIGIIGGADGPTAIYLTSQPFPYLTTIIFALLTLAGIFYIITTRKSAK